MGRHAKTQRVLDASVAVLTAHHPMTVRQCFYQLVSGHVLENSLSRYKLVSELLRDSRKDGTIPWEWVEDRTRRPRTVAMWAGLAAFAEMAIHTYRRDVWATQPGLVECWLEKDALSGIVEDVLAPYGVTLNVGRGFDGWDSIRHAAERWGDGAGVTVLYWGDFDPSGEDMVRSLRERLGFFGCAPAIVKCALTFEDIHRYHLPPDVAKVTDSRRAGFVAKYGDVSVELDALPLDVLTGRLTTEVEARMDLAALADTRAAERTERARLDTLLRGAS